MTQETLMNRVQKLLRLGESSFEEEARAALLKAQRLMEQYDLELSDLSADTAREEAPVEQTSVPLGSTQIATWKARIATIVASNFRCRLFTSSSGHRQKTLNVYGLRDDVALAREAIKYAVGAAWNGWERYRAQRLQEFGGRSPGRSYTEQLKSDYMRGFARGVREAFATQVAERAIVLAVSPRVDDYARETLHLRAAPSPRTRLERDHAASRAGYTDGKRSHATGQKLTQAPRLLSP